jgi:hypothetical protein
MAGILHAFSLVELPSALVRAAVKKLAFLIPLTLTDSPSRLDNEEAALAKTMASCALMWYWEAKARTCSMHRRKTVMKRAVRAVARFWMVDIVGCCMRFIVGIVVMLLCWN